MIRNGLRLTEMSARPRVLDLSWAYASIGRAAQCPVAAVAPADSSGRSAHFPAGGSSTSLLRERGPIHTPWTDPSTACIVETRPASTRDFSSDSGRNTLRSARTFSVRSHIAQNFALGHSVNRHWRTKATMFAFAARRLGQRSFHCWEPPSRSSIGRFQAGQQRTSASPAMRRSSSQPAPG